MTFYKDTQRFCYLCDAVTPEQCICIKKPVSVGIENEIVETTMQAINETHAQIKTAVAKRNEEEYRRIWNSAIEAAASLCEQSGNQIAGAGIRVLKK